ncbi:hypothetical protein NIES4101_25250 (plasmid) [Calothrix sp. NIES-4101]|nr:hypothetical protein NIES4101_25250 [Calothrix sp. NIES-4101]
MWFQFWLVCSLKRLCLQFLTCNGTLEELIEAAHALNLEYDYQHTDDGFDFMAWSLENEERVAKIKL